jgi:hypothetical protein
MKLVFQNLPTGRKLVFVHQMFGPINAMARHMQNFAPLISPEFYLASQVSGILKSLDKKIWVKIFSSLVLDTEEKIRKRIVGVLKDEKLISLLDQIILPEISPDYYKSIERELKMAAKQSKFEALIKKVFDCGLPEEVFVVVYENYNPHGSSGTCLVNSPCLIGVAGNFTTPGRLLGTFLHEVLHSHVKTFLKDNIMFEEALLDYFTPGGLLMDKLGFLKDFDLSKHQENIVRQRPSSKKESLELLPAMQKYLPIIGKKTIWQHLKDEGLGKYLK